MPLDHQMAQKIHGMTEPPRGNRLNERVKDVVDVILMRELLGERAGLRRVCVALFEARATHRWPPHLDVHEHWRAEFGRLAAEHDLGVDSLEEGVKQVQDLIAQIDRQGE